MVASWPGQPVMGCEQLVDVAGDLDPGVDEHDEVVTDPLQVGDEVGREDDAGAVLGDHLHQALKKLAPGEGIEARDRLVEHEQLRTLRHRQGERELGALAAGQLARLLAGVEPELLDPCLGERFVPARVHPCAEPQVIANRQSRIGRGVLGDEADAGQLARARARLPTENSDRSGVWTKETDRELEERRLAGAVRADEPDDLASGNGKRALARAPTCARSACRGRWPR